MKQIIILLLCFLGTHLMGQNTFEKSYALNSSEKLTLDFEYPELVKISTWDKQEVVIKAKVIINGEENTEDFTIENKRTAGKLIISSRLKNLDKFKNNNIYVSRHDDDDDDQSVTMNRDGSTITIGKGKKSYRYGTEIDIVLEVFLPKSAQVEIDAKYGLVEVQSIPKELFIMAKFGGADVKISEQNVKSLKASTSWGQIFSNLSAKMSINGDDMPGKNMRAEYENNKGQESVRVESEFGHIYLRKN